MVTKAYRYRIYPTAEQKQFFENHFGCCRFIYNRFLSLRVTAWGERKESISWLQCQAMLPKLKRDYPWLRDVNSKSLQVAVENLERAYKRFFKGLGRYPQFHKKSA